MSDNPLDIFEEILEASDHEFTRDAKTRLSFQCSGKQGDYSFVMEWNDDYQAVKCSVIIEATKSLEKDILETALLLANETSWHGAFMIDGVGHTIYKTVIKLSDSSSAQSLMLIEQAIDQAILEADRYSISLALTSDDNENDLFGENIEVSLDNLSLMFSDIKGNA